MAEAVTVGTRGECQPVTDRAMEEGATGESTKWRSRPILDLLKSSRIRLGTQSIRLLELTGINLSVAFYYYSVHRFSFLSRLCVLSLRCLL
jgi:hypothetical protein